MTNDPLPDAVPRYFGPMPHRSRTQVRIHDAAMRIFAERGGSGLSVKELADAAGIARGTIYNNVPEPERLFEDVATALAQEMFQRVSATVGSVADPAMRLSVGARMFVRRAQEEPHWGRFLLRFAMTDASLKALLHEPPAHDVRQAIASGRYRLEPAQLPVFVAMAAGSVLSAMNIVIDGERGWREAGQGMALLLLRAAGLDSDEAAEIATAPLPALAGVSQ